MNNKQLQHLNLRFEWVQKDKFVKYSNLKYYMYVKENIKFSVISYSR